MQREKFQEKQTLRVSKKKFPKGPQTPETQQDLQNELVFGGAGLRLVHQYTAWDPEQGTLALEMNRRCHRNLLRKKLFAL